MLVIKIELEIGKIILFIKFCYIVYKFIIIKNMLSILIIIKKFT